MTTTATANGRRPLVRRMSLFERLSAVPGGGVALVTGPAGSGKTLLVESWVQAELSPDQVAWVSVGRGERDPQRFWLSVIDQLALIGVVDAVSPAPGFRGPAIVERLIADLDVVD